MLGRVEVAIMYNDTVTVFTLHGEYWYPHVIVNADVGFVTAQNPSSTGDQNLDSFEVLINCNSAKEIVTRAGTEVYLPPKQYAALAEQNGHITFDSDTSFVYVGEWNSNEPLSVEEFDSGLYHYFKEHYDGVYKINSAAYYSLIPHFELKGK